jgi:hypothetical protein
MKLSDSHLHLIKYHTMIINIYEGLKYMYLASEGLINFTRLGFLLINYALFPQETD